MPAKSKSQQRLMGLAYAYKSGEIKVKDLNPKYADKVKDLAKSMTQKQLKDFAKTKHKKLPEKVEETLLKFREFNKILENNSDLFTKDDKITVADLIEFLQKFDPNTEVILDRDGWQDTSWGEDITKDESISTIFEYDKEESKMIINN